MSTPKSGITVKAFKNGVEMGTAVTDVNGEAKFVGLPVGVYAFRVSSPDGYAVDEGNVENAIVDANAANNSFAHEGAYDYLMGVDVAKNTLVTGKIVIAQAIYAKLNLEWISGTSYKLTLSTTVIAPEQVVLNLAHKVARYFNGEFVKYVSADYNSVLTIPVGSMISNTITINTGIDPIDPIQIADKLEWEVTNKNPGRTVVTVPVDTFNTI